MKSLFSKSVLIKSYGYLKLFSKKSSGPKKSRSQPKFEFYNFAGILWVLKMISSTRPDNDDYEDYEDDVALIIDNRLNCYNRYQ